MAAYTFVQRGIDDAQKIDWSEKNKWSWTWCEKKFCDGDDVHLVSDYIRKMTESEIAWCELCKDIIRYWTGKTSGEIAAEEDQLSVSM